MASTEYIEYVDEKTNIKDIKDGNEEKIRKEDLVNNLVKICEKQTWTFDNPLIPR